MNLKSFDKLTKRDFEDGAVINEIRQTFKDYEESLRLLHNCLLIKPVNLNVKFWDEVEEFLNKKLEEI
jgi:hypothetical protein